MNTILYKAAPVGELIDADEKAGIIKGYGSYFGNKDSDDDIITKGAYKKTIAENGERVKYLYQHDMMQPIGKMDELYEDEKGLVFVAKVPKTQLGTDVIESMIVNSEMADVMRHVSKGVLFANLQHLPVSFSIKHQERDPVLKTLCPVCPAAGGVFAINRKYR